MSLLVRDVCDPEAKHSIIVCADESLENVLRHFARESWLRSIFVTNAEGRLEGVITRSDLLHWAQLRLGVALKGPLDPERILRLAQLVRAATAKEAIHPGSERIAVRLDTPLEDVLAIMLDVDLISLPVVDEEGRILGDVGLTPILRYLLDMEETRPSGYGEAATGETCSYTGTPMS